MILPLPRRASTAALWSAALLIVCSIPTFGVRFLNDMGFYSLFADKVLSGGVLYRDAMDVKPPLVFLHYAAIFKMLGLNNVAAVKVVTMGWLASTALVLAAVARELAPTSRTPAVAGLVFILASFSGWGQDFLATNTEILANLFIVAGVWFLVAQDFRGRPLHLLAGGCCLGIAFLYRYQSCAALLGYAATIVVCHRQFGRQAVRLLLVGVGFAVPAVVFSLYCIRAGAVDDLRLLLVYQAHYTRDAEFYWPELAGRVLRALAGLWPIVLLAVWRGVDIVRQKDSASRGEVFQVALGAFSVSTYVLGGRLYPHYFIQAIPPLVLLATDRLRAPELVAARPYPRWKGWLEARAFPLLVAMVVVFTGINAAYFWTRPDEPPRRALVKFVAAHSGPDDEVLLWTWRPELLFQVDRRFATRQLVNGPLIGMPDRRRPGTRRPGVPGLWPVFLRDLAVAPPRLLFDAVPGRSEWPMHRFPELAAFLSGYHPCRVIDDVCVYLRKS